MGNVKDLERKKIISHPEFMKDSTELSKSYLSVLSLEDRISVN